MADKRSKRFQLLLYKRYHQVHGGLSKFLIVLGALLIAGWVAARAFLGRAADPDALKVMLGGSLAILVLGVLRWAVTFLVSKTAYVECRAKSLKVQTPFLPLVISYRRIRNTRPTVLREVFPPDKQKRHRNLLQEYWGETVVIVEMDKLPMSPGLLKAMMGPYHFSPDGRGLALLVDDWMGFSQSLDQAISAYRAQRVTPVAQRGLYRPRR